jgi:hypothetical protein
MSRVFLGLSRDGPEPGPSPHACDPSTLYLGFSPSCVASGTGPIASSIEWHGARQPVRANRQMPASTAAKKTFISLDQACCRMKRDQQKFTALVLTFNSKQKTLASRSMKPAGAPFPQPNRRMTRHACRLRRSEKGHRAARPMPRPLRLFCERLLIVAVGTRLVAPSS